MLKKTFISSLLIAILVSTVSAGLIIEHPLGSPSGIDDYDRVIGPTEGTTASAVDIYVENILDPSRWKEWHIEIWVLENAGINELFMNIDYHMTQDRSDAPTWIYDIELHQIPGTSPYTGFEGFYADTDEAPWEDYDTTPQGSGQGYDLGNPAWVSFHFSNLPTPFIYYIHDQCLPEPATVVLLGLGALSLLRRRRK